MPIRTIPFGAPAGFSDQPRPGTSYYTQGLTQSLLGSATLYSILNKIDSGTVVGMGNIKYFTKGPGGALFAQDDAGHILKEQTPGAYDFAIVRSPGGNGSGLMGDQYGNLLYANGSSNNQIGKYDGATWTDAYQSVTSGQHAMDTYEDLRIICNAQNIAVVFSDDSFNSAAFSLPSQFTTVVAKSGPTGILIGANFGYQGALILWDGNSVRAKTPWKWTKGQILSIEKFGANWIVKTQREVLLTNGYTVTQLFGVFDDPLSFKSYDNANILPQQMIVINDTLVFAITAHSGGLSYEFGRMKPGIYLYHLSSHAWDYIPLATGNMLSVFINSVFSDVNFNNRILIGYRDAVLGKNYIAALTNSPPTQAMCVSEVLGVGRLHYQRIFFGPTEKIAEAVVLNLGILNSITDPATETFNVALKIYNFKRQLWGKSSTNASLSNHATLQVDGTSSANSKAQVGDEVTILEGVNAGKIAHIIAIANPGASNETWTLDTALPNQTESNINMNVQPFTFIEKKTFTNLSQLKNIFFDLKQKSKGKQFLLKYVIDNIGTNLQLEAQTSYFVFDDLGYDSAT
jgi:hypothetical protein